MLDPESFLESDIALFKASLVESGGGGGLLERSVGADVASPEQEGGSVCLKETFVGLVYLPKVSCSRTGSGTRSEETGCCKGNSEKDCELSKLFAVPEPYNISGEDDRGVSSPRPIPVRTFRGLDTWSGLTIVALRSTLARDRRP